MATPRKRNPQKGGRPTLYRKSMVEQSRNLVLMGYTHEQVAKFYNIEISTLYLWKRLYPEFFNALNTTKDEDDSKVVRSLHDLAVGYNYVEKKKEIDEEGKTKLTRIKKHMAPNVGAIKVWLYNRRPEDFKPEVALSSKVADDVSPPPPLTIVYDMVAPVGAVKVTIGKS